MAILTISIVSGGSADYLKGCVESIFSTNAGTDLEVFVVDNCANFDVTELLQPFPQVTILRNSTVRGFAANHNQVLRRTQSPYAFVLNDDAVLLPGCIQQLLETIQQEPLRAVVAPAVYDDLTLRSLQPSAGQNFLGIGRAALQEVIAYTPLVSSPFVRRSIYRQMDPVIRFGSVAHVSGAGFVVRRACFQTVGLMDEKYGMYYEETDWCLRIRQAGWDVVVDPRATMVHFGGGTTRQQPQKYIEMQARSRERFLRRNYPLGARLLFGTLVPMLESFRNLWRRCRGQHDGGEPRCLRRHVEMTLSRRILEMVQPLPLSARHVERSLLISADDDSSQPSRRLVELGLDAAHRALDVTFPAIRARSQSATSLMEVWPGEHYKLLAGLIQVLKPKVVVELGTATGISALAMVQHLEPGARLTTFDILPWAQIKSTVLRQDDFQSDTLAFFRDDLTLPETVQKHRALLESADFIFIDAAKDGRMEKAFLNHFDKLDMKDNLIVMFDDIRLWNMLCIWRDIARPKLDLTSLGHWSGTGLIDWRR